jgi:hypothetical protein
MQILKYILSFCLLLNIALANDFRDSTIVDRVDIIEHNAFFDEQGKLIFDQFIFWQDGNVREWILAKNCREVIDETKLKVIGEDFLPKWVGDPRFMFYKQDGKDNVCLIQHDNKELKIYFETYIDTWTQFDHELIDREFLPKERRIPLGGRNIKIKKDIKL